MENTKKYVDYYLDRFSRLLTKKELPAKATEEEKTLNQQYQTSRDLLFVQELNGFLFRNQGISKDIKNAVIAAVRMISTRTSKEIELLMKRSPEFVDRFI